MILRELGITLRRASEPAGAGPPLPPSEDAVEAMLGVWMRKGARRQAGDPAVRRQLLRQQRGGDVRMVREPGRIGLVQKADAT